MKSNQFFSGIALVGLAASVTAGSMYVSVSASSQQETPVGAEGVAPQAGDPISAEAVVEEVAKSINQPLAPEEVIHSRSHDVLLDASGAFSGKLSAITSGAESNVASGITVKVVQEGAEAGRATTDEDGNFEISGLKPGVAALLAYGDNSFLLYGINLVASDEKHPATNEIDVASAVVSGPDLGIVRQLISAKLPKADLRFDQATSDEDQKFPLGEGDVSTSVVGHMVQLQKDGRLRGVINLLDERTGRVREVLDLTIYFIQEGKIVGKAEVENNGEFLVAGLVPGAHSVVGVGKDGTFALGIEIIGAEQEVASFGSSRYRTVAVMASLEMSLAPANAGNFNSTNAGALTGGSVAPGATPPGATPPGANPPGAPGSAAGGAGGGAGGGGGGGGLGALLVGGAIGAGIGYLAGQNDGPASPGN
jgi:hypothetical protein